MRAYNWVWVLLAFGSDRSSGYQAGALCAFRAKPRGLFTRAFEAFVFGELADRGNKSDCLVHGVTAERYENDHAGNHVAVAADADKDDAPMVASM